MDSATSSNTHTMMICYYYYPRVAYWLIVCAASTIILLISYLSLYAICCKVNPFDKCLRRQRNNAEGAGSSPTSDSVSQESSEEMQRRSMESVIRFYQFMFGITVILLIFSILLSTLLSELCFDGISNFFEEQYVAAILVLISYVMVSMTLNLLWFSTNSAENGSLCKVVATMFVVAVLIHFSGIAMLCYWMKIGEPKRIQSMQSYNTQLNNTAIFLMVIITSITYTTFWLFICKVFKYKFCCSKAAEPQKELAVALV